MFNAPLPSRPLRLVSLLASVTAVALAGPAVSTASSVVQVRNGWTVAMSGPDSNADALTTKEQTTIVVGGGKETTLGGAVAAPPQTLVVNVDLGDFGCGGAEQTAETAPCLPARSSLPRNQLIGTDGLLLQAKGKKSPPTIIAELTYGTSDCCILLAGYWRDGAGWSTQGLNSGARIPKVTASGRVAVGDPAFERLDWPFSRHQSYVTWNRLVPGKGWVDVTANKDHRSQISILQRKIKRWKRSGSRLKDDIKSARAVIIAHETAIGGSHKRLAGVLLRSYERHYGAASTAALTKVVEGV